MNSESFDIVIIGLSLSSSWGNGHATTYRSLVKGLHEEGHKVIFLEQEIEWYSSNRDLVSSPHCTLLFYENVDELKNKYQDIIQRADLVIAGSYLQNGIQIAELVIKHAEGITAFYDIDTPVTLSKLEEQDYEYIHPDLIPQFDLYLSFSGGEVLKILEKDYHASSARPLYCSVDTDLYYPESTKKQWQMGYLGTYSYDRQPTLKKLLLELAKLHPEHNFVVAGPQYPENIRWLGNVQRIEHLPPAEHRSFYNRQLFTLNVTRTAMIKTGFSPSVRLFEAAACGTPIITDNWEGLDNFFEPDREILVAESVKDVERFLNFHKNKIERLSKRAREKVLKNHTSLERAKELTGYIKEFKEVAI